MHLVAVDLTTGSMAFCVSKEKSIPAVCNIFDSIMHLQKALRSLREKSWKNNLLFASPSIRRPTPYKDKKLFSKYSLGMKQRLGIANAILHDPELLILDEPTNGLDPIGIAEVRDFIKELSAAQGKTILISSHILSEISLLADDIGIIDNGVLLEESSMRELEKKNRKYILLQVSDIPKTTLILERQFHLTDYSVQDDHTLRLYDASLDMGEVNKVLFMQDITVMSSLVCNDTLEDYFKKITGGEGIA